MKKLILCVAVSLDGMIEGPNGEYDWCFTDQDYGLQDLLNRVDSAFLGRKSYELVLKTGIDESGLAGLHRYVFSTTLESINDEDTLINNNIFNEVSNIKSQDGKDIWLWGGANLASSLINMNLVDELLLAVHPVILGQGKLLFENLKRNSKLELISSKAYSTGLVMLNYKVLLNIGNL
jgi:dihydrofolate reductase